MAYFIFVVGLITAIMPSLGFPYGMEKVWYVASGLVLAAIGAWMHLKVMRSHSKRQDVFVESQPDVVMSEAPVSSSEHIPVEESSSMM